MIREMKQRLSGEMEAKKAKAQLLAVTLFGMLGMDRSQVEAKRRFLADNRAQIDSGASKAVNLVVGLVVGGLMAAFLLPIAIDEIASVDTTSWDNGAGAMWNILPVMVVLAIFLFFVGLALSRAE